MGVFYVDLYIHGHAKSGQISQLPVLRDPTPRRDRFVNNFARTHNRHGCPYSLSRSWSEVRLCSVWSRVGMHLENSPSCEPLQSTTRCKFQEQGCTRIVRGRGGGGFRIPPEIIFPVDPTSRFRFLWKSENTPGACLSRVNLSPPGKELTPKNAPNTCIYSYILV